MDPRPFANTYTPSQTGTELVLPFDSSIFESPLAFVSELKLSNELETTTNSIGLQFSLAQFTQGTIAVIGDTLKLQTETLSDPLSSTYTVKLRNFPLPVLSILVRRNTLSPDVNYDRWFYWSPDDTAQQIIVKWNDQMRVFVDGISFGHLTMTYDSNTGRLAPLFDYSTDYGLAEGFGWFNRFEGDDASKDHIGMTRSPSHLNPGWSAGPRPESMSDWPLTFPYAAGSTRLWWINCNSGIFGKTVNGTTMNLVNSIERIEDLLYTLQEKINIVSCTATSDSWLITTDNPSGDVQINVVPAYSTEDIEVFVKNSPAFVNIINITTSIDWNNSDGWRVVSSSTFQNNASYAANAAFDKNSSTYWGSAEGTFTTAGIGSQTLTIEYPQALKISSLRFEGSTRYPGVTAPTEWTLSGSNDTTFTDIQSYEKTNWSSNIAAAFDHTVSTVEAGGVVTSVGSIVTFSIEGGV
ncbi:hypothetical protein T492DRAFT_834890 [Pavlovales sp. CCMP2436]|nr:hypothetical protein T492DRAFT_834890 [Pavlovales sp. CCMP2436]